jgi:hypothetical protein
VVLIDNYVDETVLAMLDKRTAGGPATIYTQHVGQQLQLDIDRHNAQYQAGSARGERNSQTQGADPLRARMRDSCIKPKTSHTSYTSYT